MAAQQTTFSATPARGFAGMPADFRGLDVVSRVSEEASAEIPFGQMVKQGTTDRGILRLSATGDTAKLEGVVVHSQNKAKDFELGSSGLKPKITAGVAVKGRILVSVDEAVTPLSVVRVRCTDSGGTAGTFRTTASAGNTILCSKWAKFNGTTTGAGIVELEFDMTSSNDSTAD